MSAEEGRRTDAASARRGSSGLLSERLKKLDEVGPALGPPKFDLGAVMRGGERRRRRRNAAGVGAAVVTAGAGLALAAVFASAVPGPVSPPAAAVVDLAYVQHGDSVLVSAAGASLGRVTLELAKVDAEGRGTVEVLVESDSDFTLAGSDFVWASNAQDRSPIEVEKRSVDGVQQLRLTYEEVSAGEMAWTLPGTEQLAAVWQVGPGAGVAVVQRGQVWYLQRDSAVTAYRGNRPSARVVVGLGKHPGVAQVQLSASIPYELRVNEFVWASADGSQHAPVVDPWASLAVGAGGTVTATVDFGKVEEGSLLWAPGGGETVGVWSHEDGRVG
jgi:hypothetical protein